MAQRSIDANDYQHVPRPVAAMAKRFAHGVRLASHSHPRDQLLYAVAGVMRIRTQAAMWIVPPDRAAYVPCGIEHSVGMQGSVEMRTLYIESGISPTLPRDVTLLEVSDLLSALITSFLDEPIEYDITGRGGMQAALIVDELARAPRSRQAIPMPHDRRLAKLCNTLLDDPARAFTLEQWAHEVGASPRTLVRLFKSELGVPFTAWRRRVRFHTAREALARGEPVASVAHRSGYESASAFTSAFRREMGTAPSRLAPRKY